MCSGIPVKGVVVDEGEQETTNRRIAELTAKQVVASVTRKAIDVPHISEVAGAVLSKLGGATGFADKFVNTVNGILEENPNSRLALTALTEVSKLVRESTVMRETAPDVRNISDKDLEDELTRFMQAKLADGSVQLAVSEQQDNGAG